MGKGTHLKMLRNILEHFEMVKMSVAQLQYRMKTAYRRAKNKGVGMGVLLALSNGDLVVPSSIQAQKFICGQRARRQRTTKIYSQINHKAEKLYKCDYRLLDGC